MRFDVVSELRQKLQRLGYSEVPDENDVSEVEGDSEKQWPRSTNRKRNTLIIISVLFLLLIIFDVVVLASHHAFSADGTSFLRPVHKEMPHCGSSVQEAHERNCVYDVMANGWTPQECHSHKLEEDFLLLPNSTWYYDEEHTREIPMEVLKLGNMQTVFPAASHHDRHCLYTWRRLSQAVQDGGLIDYQSGSPMHIMHCTDFMLGKLPGKPIKSERKFVSCIEVGSDN